MHNLICWCRGVGGDTDVGGVWERGQGCHGAQEVAGVHTSVWRPAQAGYWNLRLSSLLFSSVHLSCDNEPVLPSFWTSVSLSVKERD